MTKQTSPDLLDLAESVAHGELRADDAERQVRAALGPDRDAASDVAVRELRDLIVGAGAVRAHVRATREAIAVQGTEPTRATATITTIVPGPVRAGAARRRPPRGRDARAPRRIWLLVAATLAIGAGVIGASLVGGRMALPDPAPTTANAVAGPTASPNVTALPSATRAVTMAPNPTAVPLPPAAQLDHVCDFGLASTTVGWVSTDKALYRTVDLGRTWSGVQPPGWSAATSQPRSIFVDADTAYTFLYGPSPSIAVTHDGGASWHQTALDPAAVSSVPRFSFQTPSRGSVIFVGEVGGPIKTGPADIYATTDGGARWTGPRSEANWPAGPSCGHQALETMVEMRGEFNPNPPDPVNILRLSRDGGMTSYDRNFPFGPTAPKANSKSTLGFWADASDRIVMAISVADASGACCMADQVYTSADDGRSWQLVKDLGTLQHGERIAQFLSATEWVFISNIGDEVLSTVDGGAHWRTMVGASFEINEVSFASADVGWASIWCGGLSHVPDHPACGPIGTIPPLLQTTDGGRTWAPIGQ